MSMIIATIIDEAQRDPDRWTIAQIDDDLAVALGRSSVDRRDATSEPRDRWNVETVRNDSYFISSENVSRPGRVLVMTPRTTGDQP